MSEEQEKKLGLHDLQPPEGSRQAPKRLGRGHGSGRGKTSGRGHKGQKARTGTSIPSWFEGGQMPLYRRVPKRGFHSRNRVEYRIVNVGDLAAVDADEITPDVLRAAGAIASGRRPVKVLGDGELDRAVTVKAHAFSEGARRKIEEAGGTAELLESDS